MYTQKQVNKVSELIRNGKRKEASEEYHKIADSLDDFSLANFKGAISLMLDYPPSTELFEGKEGLCS